MYAWPSSKNPNIGSLSNYGFAVFVIITQKNAQTTLGAAAFTSSETPAEYLSKFSLNIAANLSAVAS